MALYACGDPEADMALLRFQLEYGSAVYVDPAPIQELRMIPMPGGTGQLLSLAKKYREGSSAVILNVQIRCNEPGSCATHIDDYYQEAVSSIHDPTGE